MTKKEKQLVLDYLIAISGVPMRAVDCDQDLVNALEDKLYYLVDDLVPTEDPREFYGIEDE